MSDTTQDDLVKQILADHALWVTGNGGKRANLLGANLLGANLWGATGNMREIRTMHIDTWPVTYTAYTLQIGCQRHSIEKWRKWDTEAGRAWVRQMDSKASDWADRNLGLILQMIDANPATPTGYEEGDTP